MKLHSMVDVITNSSSVAYIWAKGDWRENTYAFLNKVLENAGSEIKAEDVYEVNLRLGEYYADMALQYFVEDQFDEKRYGGYGEWNSTVGREKEIIAEYLSSKNITKEDLKKLGYDIYNKISDLSEDLEPILDAAVQSGELKMDGFDGMFSDNRFTWVEVKSKITGESFGLESEILDIFELEGGNDNY